MEYILSLSYGKDSLACIGACEQLGWKIDRIVHVEVWATDTIEAEIPIKVEFKKKADKIIRDKWGIEVEHVYAKDKNGEKEHFEKVFYRKFNSGKKKGEIYGFPMTVGAWCNDRLKIKALNQAKGLQKNAINYVGIAFDECERIERQKGKNTLLPLVEIGWTEKDCMDWCIKNDLRSPTYDLANRDGCWFCPKQPVEQLRLLRSNHPDLWQLLLEWDLDSPCAFKPSGHTVHDYDRRFELEDMGFIRPNEKWRWEYIKVPIGKQITLDEFLG